MTHKNDGFIENLMKVPAPLYTCCKKASIIVQLFCRYYSRYYS